MELPRRELYDIAAAIADDISGGGRSVVIGVVIATYEERSACGMTNTTTPTLTIAPAPKERLFALGDICSFQTWRESSENIGNRFLTAKG